MPKSGSFLQYIQLKCNIWSKYIYLSLSESSFLRNVCLSLKCYTWTGLIKPLKKNLQYSLYVKCPTIHAVHHSSKPLYVCHYLGLSPERTLSLKEPGEWLSQTGLWLPVSKFRTRPFCMSKLESTPSICRQIIMLRHLFVFVFLPACFYSSSCLF